MGRRGHNSRSEQPTWGIHLVAGLGSQTPPSDKMNITFANCQRTKKINLRLLKQIVNALLANLEMGEAELEINLLATPEMTQLNETFLRHAGSTDVITFDYAAPEKRRHLHGEIFVCVDEAVLQARKFGTSWQSETVRYVVHGVLHLLGHDDLRAAARRGMKREEDRLVRELSRRFSLAQLARHPRIVV